MIAPKFKKQMFEKIIATKYGAQYRALCIYLAYLSYEVKVGSSLSVTGFLLSVPLNSFLTSSP